MSAGHDRRSRPYAVIYLPPLPRELTENGLCSVPGLWPDGLWDFSVPNETPGERRERRELAVRVCQECPVQKLCARYAAENRQCGIWGGRVFAPLASSDSENTESPGREGGGVRAPCRGAKSA